MSDTLLVSTRKGLFTVRREKKQWAISELILWATMFRFALTIDAMAAVMRLSITGILASSSTVRRQPAGRRLVPRRIRPSRRATRKLICGAGPSIGARLASGHSNQLAQTSRA
jgi:hypothetical protein